MRLRDFMAWAEALLMVVAMVWISFVLGFAIGGDFVRREAVRNGSALEYIDLETGSERFEWR